MDEGIGNVVRLMNDPRCRMQVKSVWVEPEQAKAWLAAYNTNNRPISFGGRRWIRMLASHMQKGTFKRTGKSIVFASTEDGRSVLLDGQHRLYAVIESGVGAEMIVVWNADPTAFKEIADERGRTDGDTLVAMGLISERCKHPNDVAVAGKWLVWGRGACDQPPKQFFVELGHAYDLDVSFDLLERADVVLAQSPCAAKFVRPRALFLALYVLIRERHDAKFAGRFFELLGNAGTGKRGCKIRELYNYLVRTRGRQLNEECVTIFKMATRAVSWLEGA